MWVTSFVLHDWYQRSTEFCSCAPTLSSLSPQLTKTPKELDRSLASIPRTLNGMLEILQREDSLLNSNDVGSLNVSSQVDLNFLSELQLIREVFDIVSRWYLLVEFSVSPCSFYGTVCAYLDCLNHRFSLLFIQAELAVPHKGWSVAEIAVSAWCCSTLDFVPFQAMVATIS